MNPRLVLLATLALGACDPGGDGDAATGDSADDGADGSPATADDRFWLPTAEPDNTAAPSVEVDASGAMHAVYPAYAGGRAYYAYCGESCEGTDDVAVVRFDTENTVEHAMLALDDRGRPRVLLSTAFDVIYASCDDDCEQPASWSQTVIVRHDGDQDVTGEGFALDPQGRPRALIHTTVAYLGIGQKPPATDWLACDDDCHDPAQWRRSRLVDQIWQSSQLRFDARGVAHLATVAHVLPQAQGESTQDVGAYLRCDDGCDDGDNWHGSSLAKAFSSTLDAVTIDPAIALGLTSTGAPRVLLLAADDEDGHRNVTYMACDDGCESVESWHGVILAEGDGVGAGLDLVIDGADHPRFVYTHDYSIGLARCDEQHCETAEAEWTVDKVEAGGDMDPDQIFLWENCDVGAWFLHSPSLALTSGGAAFVGYQARDISGGWDNPDPDHLHDCEAGTDMTWSRVTRMPAR
ncbi:MAG: hypothetical protein K1X88_34890 [Nannocystaceae bacterium]|nr:hypothetical protein [Nannocystaceae bacterium]